MPLYRRVPKRGFTNARFRTEYTIVNVEQLEGFESGATVDLEAVLSHALTNRVSPLFKVLGDGELTRALTVRAQKFSKSAAEKIRKAGGTVVELDRRGREKPPPETPAGSSPQSSDDHSTGPSGAPSTGPSSGPPVAPRKRKSPPAQTGGGEGPEA